MVAPAGAIRTWGLNWQPRWSSSRLLAGFSGWPVIPPRETTAFWIPLLEPTISSSDSCAWPHLSVSLVREIFFGGGGVPANFTTPEIIPVPVALATGAFVASCWAVSCGGFASSFFSCEQPEGATATTTAAKTNPNRSTGLNVVTPSCIHRAANGWQGVKDWRVLSEADPNAFGVGATVLGELMPHFIRKSTFIGREILLRSAGD